MVLKKLKENSVIGIFSSSWPGSKTYPMRYKRGFEFIKSKGFNIIEGELIGKSIGYLSGETIDRAHEINRLINQSDCIISTIGGYNSNSILPYINYDLIRDKKPIIIGFSDTTIISLAVYSKTGIPTFISQALIPTFGEFPPYNEINYKYFEDILIKEFTEYEVNIHPTWSDEWINWEEFERHKKQYNNNWSVIREGKAEGILIGGNLDSITSIIGTEYMPTVDENTILLLEETCLSMNQVERNLTTLHLHGYFEKIRGLIISKCEHIDYSNSMRNITDVILELIGNRNIPILQDFDCGHTHPSILVPIGGKIHVDLNYNQQIIKFKNNIF